MASAKDLHKKKHKFQPFVKKFDWTGMFKQLGILLLWAVFLGFIIAYGVHFKSTIDTLERRVAALENADPIVQKVEAPPVVVNVEEQTEEALVRIARNQVAYYWKNHDAKAKERGKKDVITWQDINY